MKLLYLIIILPWIFCLEFKEKEGKIGIEFMKLSSAMITFEKWKLCYYYDLEQYINEINNFKENIKYFENICNKLNNDNQICFALLNKFKKYYEKIDFDDKFTKSHTILKNKKRKRSALLAPIGSLIYHNIFGLLGEDQAKYYNDKIDEIQSNAEKANELNKQQLSIIKNSLEINSQTFQEFNQKINKIENELNNQINRDFLQENINFLSQYSTMIMINHNEIFDIILEIITNTIQSKIFKLISNDVLKSELEQIAKKLTNEKRLPINIESENIYDILSVLSIKSNIIEKRIIIEIQIPIVLTKEYELYKNIPILTKIDKELIIIKPEKTYFLTDVNKTEIFPLDKSDVSNCKQLSKKIICNPYID